MIEIRPPRIARYCFPFGSKPARSTVVPSPFGSSNSIEPPEIFATLGNMPMIACAMMDFPEPDSPTRHTVLPRGMRKLTSLITSISVLLTLIETRSPLILRISVAHFVMTSQNPESDRIATSYWHKSSRWINQDFPSMEYRFRSWGNQTKAQNLTDRSGKNIWPPIPKRA